VGGEAIPQRRLRVKGRAYGASWERSCR
jgi:hypothetical protein